MGYVKGTTLEGWGVIRNAPWHFAGVYSTKEEAEQRAGEMGEGYEVRYGENREGTDDFISTAIEG